MFKINRTQLILKLLIFIHFLCVRDVKKLIFYTNFVILDMKKEKVLYGHFFKNMGFFC